MSLQVIPYTYELGAIWNTFNAEARNGHFLFDRRFMEYHANRFTDSSCVVQDENGTVIGLLPANSRGDRLYSHQGLTFGGLVVARARVTSVMKALDAVMDFCRRNGVCRLTYKVLPHIYHVRPSEDDLFWLTRNGARLVRRDVSSTIVCANPGPLSNRRKRGADKAAKAGLRFSRSERWGDFWAILEATLAGRHGVTPVHSLAEISLLARTFPAHISLHTAERSGEVLAGVVCFRSERVVHAQYIAATPEGRAVGALDGLFTNLVADCCVQSGGYFDFGISTEEQGTVLNEGLVTQKEEFGASATVYDVYELEL